MQMCRFLYIDRCWKSDQERMSEMLDHLAKVSKQESTEDSVGGNFQLLLFPEGTNLTDKTRAKSNEFAAKTNQKPLKHLLHPRTTGFSHVASEMRKSESDFLHFVSRITYPHQSNLCCFHFRQGTVKCHIPRQFNRQWALGGIFTHIRPAKICNS